MRAFSIVLTALMLSPLSALADEVRDAAIRQDLSALVSEVTSRHPNPFTKISRADFERRRQALSDSVPTFGDLKAYMEMKRLIASMGDAHTTLDLADAILQQNGIRYFPIRTTLYDDGLFVTVTTGEYKRLLGHRVVSINGRTAEELIEGIRPYVSYDNEQWLRQQTTAMLRSPQMLAAMDLASDADRSEWILQDPLGRRETLNLEGAAPVIFTASINDPAAGYLSPTYKDLALAYWFRYYPEQRLLFFKYNQCRERNDLPFAMFAADLFRTLDSEAVDHLVVDLRDNGGGNSEVWRPFLSGLQSRYDRLRRNTRFGFYGLISRLTFSSGMFAAQEIKRFAGALLIGENTGGNPDSFGNIVTFRLPRSGFSGTVSTRYYTAFGPGVRGPFVNADIHVYRDSSDVFARLDSILFRVFTAKDAANVRECRSCPVVSAASFRAGSAQSPGSLSSIFGDFGDVRTEVAAAVPLPDRLGDIEVLVGGERAPLLLVSPHQINFQQPQIAADIVEVRRSGTTIWTGAQLTAAAAPALFVSDSANIRSPGAILNEDSSGNSEQRRAARGSVLQMFATGCPADNVLPRVWIGHWDAEVLYSGASEQFPGLCQINVRVPNAADVTGLMPAAVYAAGRTSNAVTVWIE